MVFDPLQVATRFVRARRAGSSLADYPGPLPTSMEQAYAVQDAAIELWPDQVGGWKIGRIGADADRWGADRLFGPIFGNRIWTADRRGDAPRPPVFPGGFAAVEAEFVLRLGADPDPERLTWTREDAAALVDEMRVGVEIASSPFAGINDLGPAVTASDFGNNNGLILGPAVPDWRGRSDANLRCETAVDGEVVGQGSAASIPGGPAGALVFLLELFARRGRTLTSGQWISTGAATGVHPITPGQRAMARWPGVGQIRCYPVAAKSEEAAA